MRKFSLLLIVVFFIGCASNSVDIWDDDVVYNQPLKSRNVQKTSAISRVFGVKFGEKLNNLDLMMKKGNIYMIDPPKPSKEYQFYFITSSFKNRVSGIMGVNINLTKEKCKSNMKQELIPLRQQYGKPKVDFDKNMYYLFETKETLIVLMEDCTKNGVFAIMYFDKKSFVETNYKEIISKNYDKNTW